MTEVLDFLKQGGIIMIPIFAFSVVALGVFLERLMALRSPRVVPRDFLALVRKKVESDLPAEALALCEGNQSALAAVLTAGIRRAGRSRAVIKEAFEEVGRIEVTHLGRFVELLGTIAAVTPLLGLLGTVVGMIDVFRTVVAEVGPGAAMVNPASLASGIWAALLTTAAGLTVAIPAYLGYRYLISRVDHLSIEMEEVCLELLDVMAPDDGLGDADGDSPEARP